MKVLHVTQVDLYGRRFNGYDLIRDLEPHGVSCSMAVLVKLSRESRVCALRADAVDEVFHRAVQRVESRHSVQNLLYPWGRLLAESREFQTADVVHYHIIHNEVISLLDLPYLFGLKPAVWTMHDAWPMTGHCIQPVDCLKWLDGCRSCPRLDTFLPMVADRADRMWQLKQTVFSRIDPTVVVASEFMKSMVSRSPLTGHFRTPEVIPFGVHAESYLDDAQKCESRKSLGVPADDFVIMFRSNASDFKGLANVVEAISIHKPSRPTTLLTVDKKGLIHQLADDYRLVELGWVQDDRLAKALNACDVFVMPSTAEGFGLMAVEAMAAGRPVICFSGTAVESVTRSPECGVAVPMGDTAAMRAAIDRLASRPEEAVRRGARGRELAAKDYGMERYLESLVSVYERALR